MRQLALNHSHSSSLSPSSGGAKTRWKRCRAGVQRLGQRSWLWLWLIGCRQQDTKTDISDGGGDGGRTGSSVVSLVARSSSSSPSLSLSPSSLSLLPPPSSSPASASSSVEETTVEVASGAGLGGIDRSRRSLAEGIACRFSSMAWRSTSRRESSSLFGDWERDEGQQHHNNDRSWLKRIPSVVVMGWRKGYAVIDEEDKDEEEGEGREKVKEWWNIFLVGVGSISNLYIPVGDLNELDLSPGPLPSRTGLLAVLEEGIELAEL